jgi:hypothetical protein
LALAPQDAAPCFFPDFCGEVGTFFPKIKKKKQYTEKHCLTLDTMTILLV